jgi:hypothetical protein
MAIAGVVGLGAGCSPASEFGCDRECLVDAADRYLDALADRDAAAAGLAGDVRFVENVEALESGQGLWATAADVSADYRIVVPDPVTGEVGLMTLVERQTNTGNVRALLAARLRLDGGAITEAEHLVADLTEEADLSLLESPRPNFVAVVSENERMPRETMASIAAAYYEALNLSDGSLAPFADDCERQENGMITAAHYLAPESFASVDVDGRSPPPVARDCVGQMDSRRFAYIDSIDNRRVFAIDPVQGLAMGLSHFRQSMSRGPHRMIAANGSEVMWDEQREPYDLPAAHIFRITDGQIHEVEAVGIFIPFGSPTGWE